ncbi:CehA/McbA family metallohydrolase [Actinoplanes sp. TBRC 11911]|uniref:CehA/McbA family metallohydrolase n=1 Tax=Actinoplanes sp. TBRC 11911 TaxID=2729386 RepID=UPI00289AD349|nr:CehA/McbA family metallohydrolase [Actinoplanes sp. TBRC 11911]
MTRHHHDQPPHDHPVTRRALIGGAASSLLMLAAAPGTARASTTGIADGYHHGHGADRASRITKGTTLVHADLHNHTLMSDGRGDPEIAFATMRSAGLDVAALTDHATLMGIRGLSDKDWDRTGELADAADDPGHYTALRGFEWSHPLLGHVNVWYTGKFTDLDESHSMAGLYEWISRHGGLSSFNHPGRQLVRFDDFAYASAMRDRMVALEMFNQRDDFLFDGWADGRTSPLVACLNAGWRTGLTGVTDEHGDDWGLTEGKGRTGLWVAQNTRAGVEEAMRARRFFATRISGLRIDALAGGVRMGGSLPITKGDVKFVVDLDRGDSWQGKPVKLQVLRPGPEAPDVVDVIDTEVGRTTEFTVPLDRADGDWVVIRVSNPKKVNKTPGPHHHPCNDFGIAYTSPWWLSGENTSGPPGSGR